MAGDQLNLLARGWLLAERGELVPYGNPLSTGGNGPGPLTSILVGLPLAVWSDPRAATALILVFHVAAFFLFDRVAREALSPRARLLFAGLFWLNPWRLYFSGFLWNPNYLFLFGALHLHSSWRQRERASFAWSAVQAAAIGAAAQLHPAAILLAASSALLHWRGVQRLHWGGVAAGSAAVVASLAPWFVAIVANPALLGGEEGFAGRGLLTLFPLLRGVGYWLRYASFAVSEQMLLFDFTAVAGAAADAWLAPASRWAAQALAAATLLLALAANATLLRRRGRELWRLAPPASDGSDGATWLARYALVGFVASLAVYALAPTTVMMWQGLPLFHAALLPVLFSLDAALDGPRQALARRGLAAAAIAAVALGVAIAFAAPQYRCGGREDIRFPLAHHSPMFADLGLDRCPWPLGQPGKWWPDVLPAEPASEEVEDQDLHR